jgi:nucleoside-diphosphate-sugar epimerase
MKVLVTGATGFLGHRLCERLVHKGYTLTTTGRNPEMGERLKYLGTHFVPGSINDNELLKALSQGQDAIVHTAGLSSPWGHYRDFHRINTEGTEQMVSAALANDVPRFVHISTPSIYVKNADCVDVRESDPLPTQFANAYAQTKYAAEQRVLAGAKQGLETVMLRPRALIGRGDTVIMPRLLRAHEMGRLRRIGDGKNCVDLTPVENVCQAIELALRLPSGSQALQEAYNISNGDPVNLWDTLAEAFQRLNLNLDLSKSIPFAVAYGIAAAMEARAKRQKGYPEPPLTRYSVMMISRSQTLNIEKARQLLGYTPEVSVDDAMNDFIEAWRQTHWR